MGELLGKIWRGFDFRVTPLSMAALLLATVAYVIGVRYLATVGNLELFLVWLGGWLSPKGALFVCLLDRALETLLFVILPFRSHLRERSSLSWLTIGVSFAGSVLPWLLYWGLSMAGFWLICVAYLFVLAIYWMFIYDDEPVPAAGSVPA